MILKQYFNTSGIAKIYFKLKTGEDLEPKDAHNRWRMVRNPDIDILNKAIEIVYKEQKKALKN